MIKQNKTLSIGTRIRLKEDIKMSKITYLKGHEFTIYGSSYRGVDLKDDEGNIIDECLFIHDKLEII